MAELSPQPLDVLLRRMAHELSRGACFDLRERSFHRPSDLDFAVSFHGERAGNPLGPAAGPQSQLAQNIVLSYLGGGRVMELKTVQVNDQLTIPRPCIDATNVGFNVEWSQELRLPQSLHEYAKAWTLLHAVRHAGIAQLDGPGGDFVFDMSVGYDLKGIQAASVQRFLDGMLDARSELDALFEAWPKDLLAWRPPRDRVPNRLSSCITLSTFHGCPSDEIERICEHLLTMLGIHVIVKLNPTLLGYGEACAILHDRLGYTEIRPHLDSFEHDLQWNEALGLVRRLKTLADSRGLFFGAKFSNTLVVENHKSFFPASEKIMYLSGTPLHALSFELCRRFREAFAEPLPISFSAGVDSRNFADCVAAGFTPITTCTDLLKPGGYGRLPRYLDALAQRMRVRNVTTVDDFILAEAGDARGSSEIPADERERALHRASLANHARASDRVLADPRYTAEKNSAVPRRLGSKLWFFDCVNCDKCIQVCPNDANFSIELPESFALERELPTWTVQRGELVASAPRGFKLKDRHQLATFADFCNECGNCDVFCPEEGGPYVIKPRFFGSRAALESAPARLDGFVVEREQDVDRISGRHEGRNVMLERRSSEARFDDGLVSITFELPALALKGHRVREGTPDGHAVRMDHAYALLGLLEGTLAPGASSPVSAPHLPAVAPPLAR